MRLTLFTKKRIADTDWYFVYFFYFWIGEVEGTACLGDRYKFLNRSANDDRSTIQAPRRKSLGTGYIFSLGYSRVSHATHSPRRLAREPSERSIRRLAESFIFIFYRYIIFYFCFRLGTFDFMDFRLYGLSLTHFSFDSYKCSFGNHFCQIWLIEPDALDVAAFVCHFGCGHGDSATEAFLHLELGDFAENDGCLASFQIAYILDVRRVAITYGNMAQKIAGSFYA